MSRLRLTDGEVQVLKKLRSRFVRESLKWLKCSVAEKEDAFARNRYEGISRGFHWASQDITKKLGQAR